MKKLLLCALALGVFGCSNDDSNDTSSNCDCGRIVRSSSFNVLNSPGSPTPTTTFTTFVVLNNCSNLERTYTVNGNQTSVHSVGSQYCN